MAARSPMLWQARAVFVLALAALLWSVHYGAQRMFPQWYGEAVAPASGNSDPAQASTRPRPQYQVSDIVQAHLFGNAAQPAQNKAVRAPETKLQLQLIGLIASNDKQMARALIGVGRARVRSYAVGQSIDGTDAVIHAVEKDRVLLDRGGTLESLGLKREKLTGTGIAPRIDDQSKAPDGPGAATGGNAQQVSEFREKVDAGQMKLPF